MGKIFLLALFGREAFRLIKHKQATSLTLLRWVKDDETTSQNFSVTSNLTFIVDRILESHEAEYYEIKDKIPLV